MAFDFKKEYKEFYMPKNKPQIVTIPKANYIAVRGKEILMKKAENIKLLLVFCMLLHILSR